MAQLEVLVAMAEERSFSRAAERLVDRSSRDGTLTPVTAVRPPKV